MNFSESVYDLEAAVRKYGFPVVVKSENVCPPKPQHQYHEDEHYQNALKLPQGSVTLLEGIVMLEFAHVTVLSFRDQNKVMSKGGEGYVEHHLELEDQDFLLPLTFEGKCKLVHPPDKRKRYVAVTELMRDLPRWIQVNDQIVSVNSENEEVKVIHAGEIIEITGVKKIRAIKYLVCKNSEKRSVMISEDIPVNITAIDDNNSYTLKKLSKSVCLPKCIEFEEVSPYDIVIYDDIWAGHMSAMAGGPLRINAIVVKEFVLGWCIPVDPGGIQRASRTVLIHKNKLKHQQVKVRMFKSPSEKEKYIKTYFPGPKDSQYVNHKLYLLEATDIPEIVWLQDRQPFSEQPQPEYRPRDSQTSSGNRPPPLPIKMEELPESDVEGDYEEPVPRPEPGPPVPPRDVPMPKKPQKVEKPPDLWQDLRQEVLDIIHRKSKNGFDKVHAEIRKLFRHKDTPPPIHPRPTVRQRNEPEGCLLEEDKGEERTKVSQAKTKQTTTHKLKHSASLDIPSKETKSKGVSSSHSSVTPNKNVAQRQELNLTTSGDNEEETQYELDITDDTESPSQRDTFSKRPRLPLPETPAVEQEQPEASNLDDDERHDYDYPDDIEIRKLKKRYVGIDVLEADRVSEDGQTAEDFYKYNIDEVVRCFKIVGCPNIATKCEKEKIDGQFFKGLSEEEIKQYFELNAFRVRKVTQAIFNGWRPKWSK